MAAAPMFPGQMLPAEEGGGYQQDLNNILICPDCREYPPNLIEEFSSGDM